MRGEPDRAFEWLERARPPSMSPAGPYSSWALREDLQATPYLKPLHADPRWIKLMTELDL